MTPPHDQRVARLLGITPQQAQATIRLLDEGNTVPFIARYRKEMTLNLDELLIRQVAETVERLRAVDERRAAIRQSVEEQGLLTPELDAALANAESLTTLEDLYAPYRPKRRTRASIARERRLQPLADLILAQPRNRQPQTEAQAFLSAEVPTVEDALQGARDIVAEMISDHATVRGTLRDKASEWGSLQARRTRDAQDPKQTYAIYYEFNSLVKHIKPYQVLAINRGEAEKVLRVSLEVPERDWRDAIEGVFRPQRQSPFSGQLQAAITDSAERLLLPAIERDIRRLLTENAEQHAIEVFASNLRGLLSQPPLHGRVVMGIDPAYRTGCKIAVVDAHSKLLATATIYPHEPQRQRTESLRKLAELIQQYGVSLIAIGNGTASRETEALVAELTRSAQGVQYLIVNEAGASVYSASDQARQELPHLDVTLRGAVSIARRVQDPLAELVKIDPRSIGVGLYQHDVDQKALGRALDGVVESVVNQVGVEVNTASGALLQYVAGIGPKLARNIVAYRETQGTFADRSALRRVSGMGPKAFEQCAGFLRIRDGRNPLDASAIHPEAYPAATALMEQAGITPHMDAAQRDAALHQLTQRTPLPRLAARLGVGELTLADILEQLARPGRDPRADLPPPILRSDVLTMDDLTEGMLLNGTVRNVVDFGAFVDIGVKQDGLLHKSEWPASQRLSVGDIVRVRIRQVDQARGRISLAWHG